MRGGKALAVLAMIASLCAPALARGQSMSDPAGLSEALVMRLAGVTPAPRDTPVQDRGHPEWSARGLPLGRLRAFPALTLGGGFDDNVRARPAADGDAFLHIAPSLLLRRDGPGPELTAFAGVDRAQFAQRPAESSTDAGAGLSVTQASQALAVEIGAGIARLTEPRASPDAPQDALEPVRYRLAQAKLGAAMRSGRLTLSGRLTVQDLSFDDVRTAGGGLARQDFRDRTDVTAGLRTDAALTPGTGAFLAATLLRRVYRSAPAAGPDRSSSGGEVETGVRFDTSRLARGEVAAGYLRQSYGGRYRDVSGPAVRARIDAFPTGLTTISFLAGRAVKETVEPGAGGYLATSAAAELHHELLRNLVLHASASTEHDRYAGIDRTDRRAVFGAGLRYLMNRGVAVSAKLERETRSSSGAQRGWGFTADRGLLAVTLKC